MTGLTFRQERIAVLIAQGYPDKRIAQQLGISEHTVGYHVGLIAKHWRLDPELNTRTQIAQRIFLAA